MKTLITNIGQLVTFTGRAPVAGRRMSALSIHQNVSLRVDGQRVADILPQGATHGVTQTIDARGGIALPGLVDAHTHAFFAPISPEAQLDRLRSTPHNVDLVLASARAFSTTDRETLARHGSRCLHRMLSAGSTTVEIKSGFGLSPEREIKHLEAIHRLQERVPTRIVPTFFGPHAIPEGTKRDDYISSIISEMIPTVRRRRLARTCDVLCDRDYYSLLETRTILRAARGAGLTLRLHADVSADVGAAELAADLEVVTADHLVHAGEVGLTRMQRAGVIPVLLPGSSFTLDTAYPDGRRMVDLDLPVALGTDFGPTTSTIASMLATIGLAVLRTGLTTEEAIAAATLNAACALDLGEEIGTLERGKLADLVILDLDDYREIPAAITDNPVTHVIIGGRAVLGSRS